MYTYNIYCIIMCIFKNKLIVIHVSHKSGDKNKLVNSVDNMILQMLQSGYILHTFPYKVVNYPVNM